MTNAAEGPSEGPSGMSHSGPQRMQECEDCHHTDRSRPSAIYEGWLCGLCEATRLIKGVPTHPDVLVVQR